MLWKPTLKPNLRALLLMIVFVPALHAPLQDDEPIEIISNEVETDFPKAITFDLSARGDYSIESVELNYGIEVLSCTESVTRAVPEDFTPGKKIDVTWEWDMYQSGSIPPGTTVWWQWILTDERGEQFETDVETFRFEDTLHSWQVVQSESIDLYYYEGSSDFAQYLVDAGESAIDQLDDMFGYRVEETIQVFIYANSQDMHDATLYVSGWAGGYAMAEYRALVAVVAPGEYDWGSSVMTHELTHVVIGNLTFSCISRVPRWLDEGLAVIVEGGREEYGTALQQAVENDSLLSLRQIEGSFSGEDTTARLSYAQSESITRFLIDEYGTDMLMELLEAFKDGMGQDEAIESVYGFDRDGLEAAWRASIGAAPMEGEAGETDATPTRTPYPTLAPMGGEAPAEELEETPQPTQTPVSMPTPHIEVTATDTPLPPAENVTEETSAGAFGFAAWGTVTALIVIGMIVVVLVGGVIIVILLTRKRSSD
ncbi:MAG: hypothetical protein JXJ17_08690 [Anaerolineae bacterium]|nr:hypothetical protein [Anaerolineae bacterium]